MSLDGLRECGLNQFCRWVSDVSFGNGVLLEQGGISRDAKQEVLRGPKGEFQVHGSERCKEQPCGIQEIEERVGVVVWCEPVPGLWCSPKN